MIATRITGIITTYNRNSSIVEGAIKSMLNQTYRLSEIIVVDDNPDGSVFSSGLQKLCNDFGVKYIKQEGNKGACSARNLGVKNATGEFVGFLDDDDRWLPEKIEKQLKAFQKDNSIGMVFCQGFIKYVETNEIRDYYNSNSFLSPVSFEDLLAEDKIGSTSNPLIRKSVFEAVGGFWEKQPARQDYEMWIRISEKYKIIGVVEKLFVHSIHSGEQISKNTKKAYWGYRNIYKKYRRFYKKNRLAQYHIFTNIWTNKYSFNFFNTMIFFKKAFYKLIGFPKKK